MQDINFLLRRLVKKKEQFTSYLFIADKQFEKQFKINKERLIEKYNYNNEKRFKEINKILVK